VSLLKGLVKEGFERATIWLHISAALFAFTSDFLKPTFPYCTLWLAIGGIALFVAVFFASKLHMLSEELGSAVLAASLILAIFSSALLGLQGFIRNENGVLAELVPGVTALQTEVEGLWIAQQQAEEHAEQWHAEQKESQKRLEEGQERIERKVESAASITPALLAALTRPYEELTETQKKLNAKLEKELDLNQRQVRSALEILGEANVPPEQLGAELLEIARKYKDLQMAAAAQPGDDAKITALKAEAQKAVDAYREALKELTGERVPLEWAQTQANLALVYRALYEKTCKPRYRDNALKAVSGALEEFHKAGAAFYIEKAERLRGEILAMKQENLAAKRKP
jgi:hypothetical protein